MKKDTPEPQATHVQITAPNLRIAEFRIIGKEAPLVICAFGQKAREEMRVKQIAGSTAKSKNKREPKDFKACYEQARHISAEGWDGIPAAAFRAAMISACRIAGYVMTKAKLAVFIIPDGFDKNDGTPLVRITKGKPEYFETYVRLDNGSADLRARPKWQPGWEAKVKVRYDADLLTLEDISNLLSRVGSQVGIGEGRPDSKKSCGQGWGIFEIAKEKGE